jgi:hypothetical protein
MRNYINKLLRESINRLVEDYFDVTLPDNIKRLSNRYVGRGVTWYGDPNQMIVIHKDYVDGMWGNIYDMGKFNHVVEMIQDSEDNVEFECSYAMGGVTDLIDVIEEQAAYHSDRFDVDYEGKKRPASIGDDEFDRYLGDEDYFIYEYQSSDEVFENFFNKNRLSLVYGKKSLDELRGEFDSLGGFDDDGDVFDEFIRLEVGILEAVEGESGDLGNFRVQLRDGHHRVMGAIEAGERYVCVNLDKDDINKYADKITRVTNRG